MEWLKQLSNAISYIEDNLTGEISYDEAAKIARCSTYYFGRMFSYVADISLSEYIRRRKMSQAAFELQATDSKVIDIALKYGYSSPTSFNRAFQNVHGITPTAAKSQGNLLNAYPPIRFSVTVTGGSAMSYRIETKEAMRIVGIRMPLTEDMEENKKVVPGFWKETLSGNLFTEICKLSNSNPHGILGITTCLSPNEVYYYIAFATDKPVPAEMFEYDLRNRNERYCTANLFLSSALFPAENLSGGLAIAVNINPFTHVINALRSLLFSETVLVENILPVIFLLVVMCCGSFALALWKLKREMKE